MEKNTNKLIQKNNPKVIFDFLKDTKLNGDSLVVWKMTGGSKLTAKISLKVIRKFNNQLVFDVEDSLFDKVKLIASGSEFVNFFVMNRGLIFRSAFIRIDDKEKKLIVKLPEMIAQAERRQNLRLVLNENQDDCKVRFYKNTKNGSSQVFHKTCYDISSGGFSFVIAKAESKLFSINDDLFQIHLNIEDQMFDIDGRIVNLIPVEPGPDNKLLYSGYRVCVQLTNIDPITKDLIEIYVFKHIDFEEAS